MVDLTSSAFIIIFVGSGSSLANWSGIVNHYFKMNCCTEINIYPITDHHQLFSTKFQLSNQQSSLFNEKFNDGMDLHAILNPEPSASTTRSVQALDQPVLTLPSIEEILPSHEFRRLMHRRMDEQTYVPLTDVNDPRAARFLRQVQSLRTKWEQDEWHQLSNERGFRFDLCFWGSYHTFLQPIDRKRRYSNEMTQNAIVQSPAHRSATPTKSAELVENAGEMAEKAWGMIEAQIDAQAAKHENFDGDMESLKTSATGVSGSRSQKEDREACSTPEIAATSPPAPFAQPLVSNQSTLPTPQWAIKYQPGNLPLLGLEPGKWGDDITAYAPGKMPRPGRACAGDPFSTDPSLKFDWNWGLYTLLARIPGGRAKLDVLYQMCVEWCPAVNLKSHNNMNEKLEKRNSTCRHSLSQNDCFISENKMWRLANIGETKVKKPGPEKNKNPALTWKKGRPERATSGAKKSKSQRRRRSTLHCESPSLYSTLLISSFEPIPENTQHFEHLVPTSPNSQLSTWVSSSQPSPGDIQSPSGQPEALVLAEHDQGNTRVPEMGKSLTSPGSRFKQRNDRSSAPARSRRRILPSSKLNGAHEVNDQQDNTPDPEMVISVPVCSTGPRCPGSLEKKAEQQVNNLDQKMVDGATVMLSLSTTGVKAINSSSFGLAPINALSGAPTTKRKLEDGNDVSEQAASRRRIG